MTVILPYNIVYKRTPEKIVNVIIVCMNSFNDIESIVMVEGMASNEILSEGNSSLVMVLNCN